MRPAGRQSVAENSATLEPGSAPIYRGSFSAVRTPGISVVWIGAMAAACAEHKCAKASLNNENSAPHLSGFLQTFAATLPIRIDAAATEIMLTADDATTVHSCALAENRRRHGELTARTSPCSAPGAPDGILWRCRRRRPPSPTGLPPACARPRSAAASRPSPTPTISPARPRLRRPSWSLRCWTVPGGCSPEIS